MNAWRRLPRLSLSMKIFGGLVLNLVFVAVVSYAFVERDQSGWNILLTAPVREHVATVAHTLIQELQVSGRLDDAAILSRYHEEYGVVFQAESVTQSNAGDHARPAEDPGQHWGHFHGGHGSAEVGANGELRKIGLTRTAAGTYDVTAELIHPVRNGPPDRIYVRAHAVNLPTLFRYLGLERTLAFAAMVLAGSAALWWPFIWNMQRTVRRLRDATRQITAGHLRAELHERRRDELGDLADDIRVMGVRLSAHLHGQQQFVADVAHEVTSPVARMQLGLDILGKHVREAGQPTLEDVKEDLQSMADMLEELLLFSRAGLASHAGPPELVSLLPLVTQVVAREGRPHPVQTSVPATLQVRVRPALLERALSNLVRNAERYAGESATPIEVSASVVGTQAILCVRDRGPGVPADALARLGEPFYRPDIARTPNAGGVGLGLAIVRRCIASCDGTVTFANRAEGGFEARIEVGTA